MQAYIPLLIYLAHDTHCPLAEDKYRGKDKDKDIVPDATDAIFLKDRFLVSVMSTL